MSNAIADPSRLVASVKGLVPWTNGLLTTGQTHNNAVLLHRTTPSYALPEWPEGVGPWDLERQARRMRADLVAELTTRAAKVLAEWFKATRSALRRRSPVSLQREPGHKPAERYEWGRGL